MYELYDRSQFLQLSCVFTLDSLLVAIFSSSVKFAIIIQVLGEMDGDVDATIEYMIAERLAVSTTDDAEVDPCMDYACNGKYLKLS